MSAKAAILGMVILLVAAIWTVSKVKATTEKSSERFKPWYPEK